MANSKPLVLITGVNGYIASVTAKFFLDSGHYRVRGTVRSLESAGQKMLNGPLKPYAEKGEFEVVEVPNITVDGAFDEAVKDTTALLHLASPVSFAFTDPDPVLHASTEGTLTLLNSALRVKNPLLQSVVVMSSIASVWNQTQQPGYVFTEKDWNHQAEAECTKLGKETPGRIIYSASKNAGERVFWEWREKNNPTFAMSAVNPVFVIGPPISPPTTPEAVPQTTLSIYGILAGAPIPPPTLPPTFVDARDVAKLLLFAALNPKIANGERYIAHGAYGGGQAVADILRKAYPDRKIQEGNPGQGYDPAYKEAVGPVPRVDASKAESVIGKFIPYEVSVLDTARAYEGVVDSLAAQKL